MKFIHNQDHEIAYIYKPIPLKPTILFLHGYMTKDINKTATIQNFAKKKGYGFLLLKYQGHAPSTGNLESFTIPGAFQDVLAVLNALKVKEPLILVGHSLGSWLAFLLIQERKNQILGVLSIASGIDFTKRVWQKMDGKIQEYLKQGNVIMPCPESKGLEFNYALFALARPFLLLHKKIEFDGPVILMHGELDLSVPLKVEEKLLKRLSSARVELRVYKGVGHRFHLPPEQAYIEQSLQDLIERI